MTDLNDIYTSNPLTELSSGDLLYVGEGGAADAAIEKDDLFTQIGGEVGGGGLTSTNVTVTTSNVNAAEGNLYNATIAGQTAHRNFVLPAPSAAGKQVGVTIADGDNAYAFILIGDTGVTINGGSAATEWSRLFIRGETVIFYATSTSNWQVMIDRRIPCNAEIQDTDQQSIANVTVVTLTLNELVEDNCSMANTGTYLFTIRRAGTYVLFGGLKWSNLTASGRFLCQFANTDDSVIAADDRSFPNAGNTPGTISGKSSISLGQTIRFRVYQNSGASQNTSVTGSRQYMSIMEVLKN